MHGSGCSLSLCLFENTTVKADAFDKWATKISIIILYDIRRWIEQTFQLACVDAPPFLSQFNAHKIHPLTFWFYKLHPHFQKTFTTHTHSNDKYFVCEFRLFRRIYTVHTILAYRKSRLCLCVVLTYAHARTCKYKFLHFTYTHVYNDVSFEINILIQTRRKHIIKNIFLFRVSFLLFADFK